MVILGIILIVIGIITNLDKINNIFVKKDLLERNMKDRYDDGHFECDKKIKLIKFIINIVLGIYLIALIVINPEFMYYSYFFVLIYFDFSSYHCYTKLKFDADDIFIRIFAVMLTYSFLLNLLYELIDKGVKL